MMKHRTVKIVGPFVLSAMLTLCLVIGGFGCEQRVVGVRNSWAGSQLPSDYEANEKKPKQGLVEGVGDLLFGWTRHLGGEEPSNDESIDISHRMTRPAVQSSQ